MIGTPFIAHRERFALVGSTNDVVRGWLAAGIPEVCVAVADEQSAGRGREGRTWTAPRGHALLLSLGFRPTWLAADRVWRLAAVTSLAMAEAGELLAGLPAGAIRLKWPNDLVVEADGAVRKLAGVLGETDGLGSTDPRAVVGIGINADWPLGEFPPDLADGMTSLLAAGGRRIDEEELLDAFLAGLEPRIDALRGGRFDGGEWAGRQLTNGRPVRLVAHGGRDEVVRAIGVDADNGALLVEAPGGGRRAVVSGEIQHLRLESGV
jgi:BirA family transcriptional regulator, biotin operon repressor / biotin---[acetyl-CoA-carboxylase] ligase